MIVLPDKEAKYRKHCGSFETAYGFFLKSNNLFMPTILGMDRNIFY